MPVRVGDNLTIHRPDGSTETTNTRTGEITHLQTDAQGNTLMRTSVPDGEGGRTVTERTIDGASGEVIEIQAYYLDSFTGLRIAIDPVTHEALSPDEMGPPAPGSGADDSFNQPLPDIGTPPEPGDPIAVIADGAEGVTTDSGVVNGYGDTPVPAGDTPVPAGDAAPEQDWPSVLDILGEAQTEALTLGLQGSGLDPAALNVIGLPDGTSMVTNQEGDVVGYLSEGYGQTTVFTNLAGQEVITDAYGQQWSREELDQLQQADTGLSLLNSVVGLENWSQLNDAQRLNTLVNLYNQIDNLSAGALPGNLGGAGGALGGLISLVGGIENDNALQVLSGGIQLGNAVGSLLGEGSNIVSSAIADSAIGQSLGVSAGQVVPILNLIIALDNIEENPWGAVAAAAAFIPVYGQIIAAVITIVSALFPADIDPSIGEAEVHIDANGQVVVNTTQDDEGGGSTAAHWAEALAHMAQQAGMSAPQAGAAAQHLPSVGYYFDPDGFNFEGSAGQLVLRWTEADGTERQRVYDSSGMAWDGDSVPGQSDIMRDYLLLCQSLEPNWPPVMYQEVAGGILQLDYGVATVLYATALGTYDNSEAHTHGGEEDSDGGDVLIDENSFLMYGFDDHTIENSSEQTEQTLGAGQINTVPAPAAMGANPNGPQIPRGRNPIVFVPIGAGGGSVNVTSGMVQSLDGNNLFSDAQLAAMALALGAGALPLISHAGEGSADTQGEGGGDSTYDWGINGSFLVNRQAEPFAPPPSPGGWTDANGQTIAPGGTTWPAATGSTGSTGSVSASEGGTDGDSALQTPRTETPELISEPAATDAGPGGASALPPGFGAQESGDTSAVLQAGEDLVLDYPTAQGDQLQGTEDQGLRFSAQDLLANDSTPNPVPRGSSGDYFNGLRIISVGEATHGQVGILNGELVFIPDPNYNGIATFSYTVQDMYGLTHTGTTSILVQAVNDTPEARGESASGSEDAELLFTAGSLLRNDRDIDGDSLRISRVGEASGGTVFLQPDGSVRFVPTPNYNGPAGYAYWVSDGHEQVRAEVNLSILQVNDLPVVQGELVGSDEDVVLNFPFDVLLANDSDIDTDPTLNQTGVQTLTISAVGNAQHGTVEIVDGQVRFTPDLNYFGPASFDYRVDDGAGGQVSTTVVLNLAPVNDAPDVQGEEAVIAEDNVLIYTQADLLANDSDVDNAHGELRITQVGGAQNGSVELLPDGRIRFIPDADYFGPAQFDYLVDDGAGGQSLATVTLDVTPVNDAPRLQAEQADVDEDTVVTLSAADLLANDHDVDNAHDELRITSVGGATHGTVAMDAQGHITFTPTLNFYGQASFSYTVSDGVGGESTTTMTLDYASVNDLPVVNDELVLGKRDNTYTFTAPALLANDTDVENPAGLQIVAVGGAENGTVTMLPDGRIQFVPAGGYDDWDPAQYGSFEYTVRDPDGGETVGHVDIDYERVNVNPVAVDDAFQGYEDVRMEINVSELLRNDSDPDASGLTSLQVDQVGSASHGTVSLNNGVVTFTPQHDYYGAASFQYRANDGEGGTTWATAHIDLERENRAPVIDSVDILGAAWLGRANATLAYGYFPHWDEGIDPYFVRTEPVSDRTRANGRIYAHDPDGDAVTFTVQFNHKPDHGNVFINYYAPLSTPRYLSSAQLMGAQPTYDWDRYNSGMGSTVQLPGVDPDHLDGANTNYLVRDASSNGHNAYAAWQYIVTDVTSYTGLDSFTVTATDSRGASTTYTINVQAVGWGNANNGYPPIVVDMNGNGLDLLPPNYSMRTMDVNLDGTPERIGWVAPTDAVLAFDKDGDGLITDPDETSFVSYKPGARTDLEGLAAFDTDGDGRLTASDEQWDQFGLLQDHNNNGVQDEGEWMSLTDQGVESIGMQSEGSPELNNGNVVFGTTTVTFTDGGTTTAGDVMFAAEGVELPDWVQEELAASAAPVDTGVVAQDPVQDSTPAPVQASTDVATEPSASTTEPTPSIEQQANVFTQTVATQDVPSEPLGFVDANQLDLAPEPDVIIVLHDEPTVSAPSAPTLVPA
ncbi:hypothetical protein H010_02857 [Hydrogenophaga taeniospiralis CCUG 15921]|uniref:Cadherin-like domain-containing protein n=1 Tax=Hydrogenophaga taeniospiralis CCUG 15921 TaxID=1281780 RepID=A0A9X4NPE9_9BURK|nr:tandem-95 repeat protein [Hydrogenophaga taeniospiralis]MDG5974174.1 hypothetical protein [Hydrogenophaga taeniospiralis CCUG 15921]